MLEFESYYLLQKDEKCSYDIGDSSANEIYRNNV